MRGHFHFLTSGSLSSCPAGVPARHVGRSSEFRHKGCEVTMDRRISSLLFVVVSLLVLLPTAASAQSAFSGIVRDTSGAVLPGVSVEAASPVLIEKTRTVVTDEQG